LLDFFGLIQINQIAMAIKKYKVNQVGANTQSGGLKEGFAISEYQGSFETLAVKAPILVIANVVIINTKRDKILFLNIFD